MSGSHRQLFTPRNRTGRERWKFNVNGGPFRIHTGQYM
jgi:hypothetical protein